MSNRYEDLQRLHQLKEQGVLSEREYQVEKKRVLKPPIRELALDVVDKHSETAVQTLRKIALVGLVVFVTLLIIGFITSLVLSN